MELTTDVVVLGAGSAGLAFARAASGLGASVVVCEPHSVGGTCVNRGCVPKKLMHQLAHRRPSRSDRALGWQHDPSLDWSTFRSAMRRYVGDARSDLRDELVDVARVIEDAGVIEGPGRVRAGQHRIACKHIVIATGAAPRRPEFDGVEFACTSEAMFELERPPERLAIIGGGYIGVEFASILARLGAGVQLLTHSVLSGFDADLSRFCTDALKGHGVGLRTDVEPCGIERSQTGALQVRLREGSDPAPTDVVLVATGRAPRTSELTADRMTLELDDDGAVVVDEATLQTSASGVYAIGDCSARKPLTPVAKAEGTALARALYGSGSAEVDLKFTPSAVFGLPPMASTGLTEAQARDRFGDSNVEVACKRLTPLEHGAVQDPGPHEQSLVKWVLHEQVAVGCHLAGDHAPDVIQPISWLLASGTFRPGDIEQHLRVHPTATEELAAVLDAG
ncbi:MAG: dihydrolipoyl dehydrogenase family protein [Nannocystaceae bacterium]|nr:FAD-dependent oxidoreductase [bacterium]